LVGHPRNGSVQAVGQTREEEHPERVVIVFIDQESDKDRDEEDAEDGQAVWNVHDAAGGAAHLLVRGFEWRGKESEFKSI
jgi:hypothetical protein